MAVPSDGRFTAGIQGTSLSITRTTSASASIGFGDTL
jgi:hypothetical protein